MEQGGGMGGPLEKEVSAGDRCATKNHLYNPWLSYFQETFVALASCLVAGKTGGLPLLHFLDLSSVPAQGGSSSTLLQTSAVPSSSQLSHAGFSALGSGLHW